MIFAAGKGTRLKPLTDTVPKAMLPVAGKPLIQHVLENVATKPGNLVVVNVHHHAPQIVNFIDITRQHWKAEIRISHEDTLLETGGGLKKAAPLFMNGDHTDTQPILIHNVDIISNVCLRTFYNSHRDTDDATLLVSRRPTQRYLIFDNEMRLAGWTNITTGSVRSPHPQLMALDGTTLPQDFNTPDGAEYHLYAFSGLHIFSPALFPVMLTWPEHFPIIDFYLDICHKHNIRAYIQPDLRLLDVGKLDTLAGATAFVNDN